MEGTALMRKGEGKEERDRECDEGKGRESLG